MSKIEITQEILEAYAPATINAETFVCDSLKEYFDSAYLKLGTKLLGSALTESLPGLFEAIDENDPSTLGTITEHYNVSGLHLDAIKSLTLNFIVKEGLAEAIPQLDLVLTNNGFGVVSTDHIAPASKERVDRLIQQCIMSAEQSYNMLVTSLAGNSLTKEGILASLPYKKITQSLIWTNAMFKKHCFILNDKYDCIAKSKALINRVDYFIKSKISKEQFEDITKWLREATWDASAPSKDAVFQAIADLLYEWFDGLYYDLINGGAFSDEEAWKDDAIDYMDNNIDYFESYENSSQYKVRHEEPYKNSKEDGCYFFN